MNMVMEKGAWSGKAFFRFFRSNLRNATQLWLILLLLAALLGADVWLLRSAAGLFHQALRLSVYLGWALWGTVILWTFPLTSIFETGIPQTLKNALLLGISWFPRTLVMAFLWFFPLGLVLFLPAVFYRIAILFPVLLWGCTAYLCALLLRKPLAPYLPDASPGD
jgi:uncharacterized membrane protein YesL